MKVFTGSRCLDHVPPHGHPEAPVRLETVLRRLSDHPEIPVSVAPAAPSALLASRHAPKYLSALEAMSAAGGGAFDEDTPVTGPTWGAVLDAAGAALAAVEWALAGHGHAFAAVRPPGHHALPSSAMGFCFVNHVAVMAAEGHRRGRERVLIIDWDVHHGNGTQAMIEREPGTRFVSMHQWPWYPGTGSQAERGVGNCFNLPMAAGLPATVYLETLWQGVVTATRDWPPELILVSAGYDAMLGDPLGGFSLEPADFAEWTVRLRERFPEVPIVMTLEGGYAPARLADGVMATLQALR